MADRIRVGILDDHQSVIDGHTGQLEKTPGLEVLWALMYGEEVAPKLANEPVDVLLMDVNVPTSEKNSQPYPLLQLIPQFLQQYPDLSVLVISMHTERALIKAVIEAGASGYILKSDRETIQQLGAVVLSVASGGICFSQQAHQQYLKHSRGHDPDSPLTARQLEVLSVCAAYPDASTSDVARRLNVANSTVRNLLSGAYLRLEVRSRPAAVEKARQMGLITPFVTLPLELEPPR